MMDLAFDTSLAVGYKGKSQIARVLTEGWVEHNGFCPICGNPALRHCDANDPVKDFICENCENQFELKSKQGNIGKLINDGAYETMIERITSIENPHFFFMTYRDYRVCNLVLIPNHYFVPEIIIKRKPLPPNARRAGWVGCNINIGEIPPSGRIYIVQDGEAIDKSEVLRQYSKTTFLRQNNLEKRGWILDVLSCVERIPSTDFTLDQVYSFIPELQLKHPDNNNVDAKIRQQLQFLRDQGYIEFTARGHYRKI